MRPPSLLPPSLTRAATNIDDELLRLLPWMVLRYDFVDGAFRGKGQEADAPPALITAQASAILVALGLHERLPHVARAKLATWPKFSAAVLAAPARGTPLARALAPLPFAFSATLAPYLSHDFGYTLHPCAGGLGRMAAAYHLLVEVRPAWFRRLHRAPPPVHEAAASCFLERLMLTFAA